MAGTSIQKRSDPAVRLLRAIRDGKDDRHVFVEGSKAIGEMVRSGWAPHTLYCSVRARPEATRLRTGLSLPTLPIVTLSDDVMSFVSDLAAPPGLIAVAKRQASAPLITSEPPFHLVLSGLQLPQNVGALLRTAEAAGVHRVWLTKGTADPFGPKVIRGSSGSVFRVPVGSGRSLLDVGASLKSQGMSLVATSAKASRDYDDFDWRGPVALAIGSEGAGFSADEERVFDVMVRIPMAGAVESLNAAAAAAVCMFEVARQRRREATP